MAIHSSTQHLGAEDQSESSALYMTHSILAVKTPTSLLFAEWCMATVSGLVTAIVLTGLVAILHEGIQQYRNVRLSKTPPGIDHGDNKTKRMFTYKVSVLCKVQCTMLHMLQLLAVYYLMLNVMTGNIWLFLSVGLGSAVGYWLVRPAINRAYFSYQSKAENRTGTWQEELRSDEELKQKCMVNGNDVIKEETHM